MKKLLLLLVFLPFSVLGQEDKWNDPKYLRGAVPEENGVVSFTRKIEAPGLTREQVFETVSEWAEKYFQVSKEEPNLQPMVVKRDVNSKEVVCRGQEYVVFSRKLLAEDRAVVNYQFQITCETGMCVMKVNSIVYNYRSSQSGLMELLRVEKVITDEYALSKKNRLYRIPGKFRIGTIDLVDRLAGEVAAALDDRIGLERGGARVVTGEGAVDATTGVATSQKVAEMAVKPATETTAKGITLNGFRKVDATQIPGNIIKLLGESWSLITVRNGEGTNMMTASWGGIGRLYEAPVAFCFINPDRNTYQLMEKDSVYTISFYTEAYREQLAYCGKHSGEEVDKVKATGLSPIVFPSGARAFSEAWMIIECRKMVAQPFAPEALQTGKLKERWAGKPLHQLYIGEIVNVWIK